jgi:threonine dehydrogenase-like Zn-dependent dehydrogenase
MTLRQLFDPAVIVRRETHRRPALTISESWYRSRPTEGVQHMGPFDIVIIGCGSAGLGAAGTLRAGGKSTPTLGPTVPPMPLATADEVIE